MTTTAKLHNPARRARAGWLDWLGWDSGMVDAFMAGSGVKVGLEIRVPSAAAGASEERGGSKLPAHGQQQSHAPHDLGRREIDHGLARGEHLVSAFSTDR